MANSTDSLPERIKDYKDNTEEYIGHSLCIGGLLTDVIAAYEASLHALEAARPMPLPEAPQ